jgi:Methyltransferase domain
MADAKLFEYYARQDVLPTFGDFKSPGQLERYAAQRRELFSDKLMLPPKLFHDAEVLEFGPDSGENAMVFAGWGARMTLAEPNRQAHDKIRAYFERFGLEGRLRGLVSADVEGFCSEHRFDFVDAEGFIYTVQPTESWLRVFGGLLKPDGCAVVSYYERHGGFFELALKAIHAAGKALTGLPARESAKLLFDAKWNSIPHTRSFESWLMDVLENPFVRYRYFLDAATLCRQANSAGFDIHAAWPPYRDSLDVYWHKTVRSAEEKLDRTTDHLRRSTLSFLGGQKLYLFGNAGSVDFISSSFGQLTRDADRLVDDPFDRRLTPFISRLASLRETVRTANIFADDGAVAALIDTLTGLHAIFSAIERRDINGLIASANSDAAFIRTWGMPAHFLVLRKRFEASQESL